MTPSLRSRGLLCLDALRHESAAEAVRYVERQRGADYNPFNLLIASREGAFVAYNRWGEIEVVSLTPGFHLLTNLDVDDFECPRISRSHSRFAELGARAEFTRDPVAMREELHNAARRPFHSARPALGTPQFALYAPVDSGTRERPCP